MQFYIFAWWLQKGWNALSSSNIHRPVEFFHCAKLEDGLSEQNRILLLFSFFSFFVLGTPPVKKTNPRQRINAKPLLRFVGLSHLTPPPQTPLPPAATARRHPHLVQPQRPVQRRGLRHLPQRGAGQAGCGRALQPPFLRPAGPLGPLQLTSGTCRPPRTPFTLTYYH